MSETTKKGWGQWGLLVVASIGIGAIGLLSNDMYDTVAASCPEKTKDNKHMRQAGSVTIGTAIGLFILAFSNKFNFNGTPLGRSGLMIMLGLGMIIIGAISFAKPVKVDDKNGEESMEETCSTQERLGSVLLGFGLGIIIPSIIKLFVSLKDKGEDPVRINQLSVAFGTFIITLYATIVGSWSWNNFDKCDKTKPNLASTLNGISTVFAALICVYAIMFGVLRSRNSPVADYMADFSKSKDYVRTRFSKKPSDDSTVEPAAEQVA
jgi:hypothetical protein